MRLKIRTYVIFSFSLMLLLLASVTIVAHSRIDQIGELAGDLNSRVVDKTRIAAAIVDLGQQIRFVDGFLLKASDAERDTLAQVVIGDRIKAIEAQTASYQHYITSPLERALLINLQRSRSAYLKLQQEILATPLADRRDHADANEEKLADAFDQANRQARGLSHLAEADARSARNQAAKITQSAQQTVLAAAGFASLVGLIIPVLLLVSIFRPLTRITRSLIGLSQGRLDVPLYSSGRGDEIDAMAQALDVFRQNAMALTKAHEEAKAAHLRADSLARHDVLTGLPNRRMLAGAIDEAIARSGRRGLSCAVLLLDLDRFKPVNDIYGHGAGDKVLCEVAGRLGATARAGEIAARLGGDEFAVVLEFEPGTDAPHRVAKRIIASITAPIPIDGRSVSVGTSIGIAVWPSDGQDAETLLHAADLAMFKAKRDERGSFRFFEADMDVQLRARADLEARVSQAIDCGDIRPYYQPLVDLRADTIIGFEILARWYDGEVIRTPGEFLQIVEDAGLVANLTFSVLRQACRDARAWPDGLTLALNITPAQIADLRLPETLLSVLGEEDFPPARLELEITENALIGDISAAKNVIARLRARGIKISLDDFGTGYSSLHHLRDLQFDKIKIDRSFVQSMRVNTEATKIVETILALGRSLGIFTLAEGIEDSEHLQALIEHGCEFGQGYHLGRPLAAAKVGEVLARDAAKHVLLTEAA